MLCFYLEKVFSVAKNRKQEHFTGHRTCKKKRAYLRVFQSLGQQIFFKIYSLSHNSPCFWFCHTWITFTILRDNNSQNSLLIVIWFKSGFCLKHKFIPSGKCWCANYNAVELLDSCNLIYYIFNIAIAYFFYTKLKFSIIGKFNKDSNGLTF